MIDGTLVEFIIIIIISYFYSLRNFPPPIHFSFVCASAALNDLDYLPVSQAGHSPINSPSNFFISGNFHKTKIRFKPGKLDCIPGGVCFCCVLLNPAREQFPTAVIPGCEFEDPSIYPWERSFIVGR